MNKNPQISVVITSDSVDREYFETCLDSILDQTFKDFEVIIILEPLDKSNLDDLKYIKDKYCDSRFLYYVLDKKRGFSDSLNYGIEKAKGKYIARMDIDDICMLNRFELQFNFMENNPNCIVCGSNMKKFGDSKSTSRARSSDSFNRYVNLLFCKVPIFHPTAFIRREAFQKVSYSNKFKAEDYKLWVDLAIETDMEFRNIQKNLVRYRVHKNQVSNLNKDYFRKEIVGVCVYYLEKLALDIKEDDINFHRKLIGSKIALNFANRKRIEKHLRLLKEKIEDKYDIILDKSFFYNIWYCIFHHFNKFSFSGFLCYVISPYFRLRLKKYLNY